MGPTAWWVTVHRAEESHTTEQPARGNRASRMLMPPKSCLLGWLSALQNKISHVFYAVRKVEKPSRHKQAGLTVRTAIWFSTEKPQCCKQQPVTLSGWYWLLAWPQGLLSSSIKCQEIEILLPVHFAADRSSSSGGVCNSPTFTGAQSCRHAEAAQSRGNEKLKICSTTSQLLLVNYFHKWF